MGDEQSGHNDNSPTKLNSIHHKVVINTNRVEGIGVTDYNTSCNCEMRWDVDGDGADVGDDVDDDLDDGRDDDDDDDGDDLPFREVISPAESEPSTEEVLRMVQSIIAPQVLRKGLPKIIGQKLSCTEPSTRKSVGYFTFPQ